MSSGYTFGQVARMEWIKLRGLRSVRLTLLAGMAGTVALGFFVGHSTRGAQSDPASNLLAGVLLGQLITGILGVLAITSEYSSGLVRVTFSAVPRRGLVLLAKAAVTGGVFLVASEITTVASLVAGTAALRSGVPHPSLGSPAVLRAVFLTGAYMALTGLIGLGIGAVVRHSAAAVGTLVGVLFVAPIVVATAVRNASRFMPELIATNSLSTVKPVAGYPWSPWLELGIVGLYPAALLVAGAWLLVVRDA